MTRGTHGGAERVGPASKRQGMLFGRESKERFVLGGTRKAEGRRAAGRRRDPERVPESAENTYFWSEHRRLRSPNRNQRIEAFSCVNDYPCHASSPLSTCAHGHQSDRQTTRYRPKTCHIEVQWAACLRVHKYISLVWLVPGLSIRATFCDSETPAFTRSVLISNISV